MKAQMFLPHAVKVATIGTILIVELFLLSVDYLANRL